MKTERLQPRCASSEVSFVAGNRSRATKTGVASAQSGVMLAADHGEGKTRGGQPRPSSVNRTKLRPPSCKSPLIERPHLVRRLQGTARPRLALIQAPAGFGKTSLLSQCFHESSAGAKVAWLSLDATDNDCTRFLRHLIVALETVGVMLGLALEKALKLSSGLAPLMASDLLSNAMADLHEDVIVCVDDFHVLTDAAIEQFMASLLQNPCSRLSWLIATRVMPSGLPLSRLRMLGELVEVCARDLKFTAEETRRFFDSVTGVNLAPEMVELVNERAEGWVAGLQMASLSLAAADDPAVTIRRFSGMNRNVAEFLYSEVLARLDRQTCRFLLDTAVLTRMNTELCNYVTQGRDARGRLDELEAINLFIFSLDDERNWYRYHQLFAEFLEQRLRELEPERAREVHERAAEWLEKNGQGVEAIGHALKARSFHRAARVLDELELYEQGQMVLQERLVVQIPREVLDGFPNLKLERHWGWQSEWQFTKCRQDISQFKRLERQWRSGARPVPHGVDLDYVAAKIAHRELMLCLVTDNMGAARRLCERWLAAGHPVDAYMELSAKDALRAARREHYACDDVGLASAAAHEAYQEAQFSFGAIFQDCISGLSFLMQGDAARARQVYERALGTAVALHGQLSPLASMPALLLAELHYEQGALPQAQALVDDYLDLAHGLGYVDKLIAGFMTKSRLQFLDGGHEAAQRTLDEAERYAAKMGFDRLRAHALAERMRQLLLSDKRDEAVELARASALIGSSIRYQPHEAATTRDEVMAIAWSRAALARGELDAPIRLLKNWYQFTLERRCYRASVRLAVELVKLLHARDDLCAACGYLRAALGHGRSGRFLQVFLDWGEDVREVLNAVLSGTAVLPQADLDYARELDSAFGCARRRRPARRRDALLCQKQRVGLNRREKDILELAAGDVPNREIARRLALSENTVKWYWKGIFSKLEARRRLQAINRARAAGIIF